ncbi:MAG: MFS transporter [Actinomycetota bacterium]|nr:MFS transporter [Actinomycetota bacterium]
MRPVAAYLRSLNPQLPRPVWMLQAGGLANMFGNGVVVPFLIIYLHNVRGISLGVAGLIAAANAAAALASGPLAGALADRIGARQTLIGALLVMSGAFALFPLITEAWHALALNALAGLGSGAFWPSQGALLTGLTPRPRRHAAFAQQRVTMNLGIGLGGLVGGLIATTTDPASFTVLFLLDAATFLVFAAVLTRIPNPAREPREPDRAPEGYAAVLRDRPFMAFIVLNTVFIAASIALLSEFFPVFAKNEAGVSESGIGLIFFFNTLLIVILQLPIAKLQEGRRRMTALTGMAALFAVTWLMVLAGGVWLEAEAATAFFAVAFLIFAVGECLHGTVQGPLVSDLAPRRLLGRYMALSSSSWQVAFVISPAAGGFILQAEPFALWPIAAAVCVAGGAYALVLERRLPRDFRRTPAPLDEETRLKPVEVPT